MTRNKKSVDDDHSVVLSVCCCASKMIVHFSLLLEIELHFGRWLGEANRRKRKWTIHCWCRSYKIITSIALFCSFSWAARIRWKISLCRIIEFLALSRFRLWANKRNRFRWQLNLFMRLNVDSIVRPVEMTIATISIQFVLKRNKCEIKTRAQARNDDESNEETAKSTENW